MIFESQTRFPAQKKSTREKTDTWMRSCIDSSETLALFADESIRKSIKNKRINYDLYSDILDQTDVERICNPHGIVGLNAPAKMQNYPICNPKIDLLVGESIKRKFDWKIRVINEDAISAKERDIKKRFEDLFVSHVTSKATSNEQIEEDLKRFEKWKKYEYQDLREKRATQILKHLWKKERLDYKFAKGFKDALICGEEIYQVDIVAGQPVLTKLNPKNVYTLRSGESPFIEDSDVIVIAGYLSPGKIIDEYHEYLKPGEIDQIERKMIGNADGSPGIDIGYKPDIGLKLDEALAAVMSDTDMNFDSPYDINGNIKVIKVYWKSMRKMLKVKFYDEFGDEQYELYDENYKVDKSKGEEATVIWVNEWWEGHKIGGGNTSSSGAIYVKMQPRPVQFRSMENPSLCHPGIVGTVYQTNDNEAVSLMDRMKPYQYLYNILAYNTELMITKNKGKIMAMDLSVIPENWKIDQWLSFAQSMNIMFYDSFKEGDKGAAQGKLAGAHQGRQPMIDMEMGNSIQLYMNMMNHIKNEMGEIAGVSQARQGQIATREAVNNVEREVTQSSHITEYWFMEHDFVKIRVMEALLETAKVAWKDKNNKKVQFVLDDGSTEMFELDSEFCELDYDIAITDGSTSAELLQTLKQLAHAGLQNQMISFSQLIDIFTTDSISSIKRKLEIAEEESIKRSQESEKMKQQMQAQQLDAAANEAERERQFTREEWDREDKRNSENNETKILIEQMRQNLANAMDNFHSSEGDSSIDLETIKQDLYKLEMSHKEKMMELAEKKRHNLVTEQQKDKDLAIKKIQKKKSSN